MMPGSQGEAAAGSCHSRSLEPPTASFPEYGWVCLLVAFRAYSVILNKLGLNAQPLGDHVGDSEERYHGLSGTLCGNGALVRGHCPPVALAVSSLEIYSSIQTSWPSGAIHHNGAPAKKGPSTRVLCHHRKERSPMICVTTKVLPL